MNNRYICRGKGNPKYNDGEWYYGYLTYDGSDYQIVDPKYGSCKRTVLPETIGQCTTLTDKNGKLIFTGDILHVKTGGGWTCPVGTDIYYEVFFTEFNEQCDACTEYIGFMAGNIDDDEYSIQYLVRAYGAEVIGNIHDNPELLEVER